MSIIKILVNECLDESYYATIQTNAQSAILRIKEFTQSSQFQEADNILLEIKLELLDKNFMKFLQCNDLPIHINSQHETSQKIEDLFIEIKAKLKRKHLSNLENVRGKDTVTSTINIPQFDGNKDNYNAFIDIFNDKIEQNTEFSIAEKMNYLKSSLTGVALDLIKDIEPKDDEIYKEMLEVLKRRFGCGHYVPRQSESSTQQKKNKMPYDTNPAHIAFLNEKEVSEELYKNIVEGSYSYAVEITKNISSSGHGGLITRVVIRLIQEGNKNLMSYVYKLWSDERALVEDYVPETFKMIFSDWVTLIDKKFGLALKMDANVDRDGDRIVWGDSNDKTSRRVNWKLIPFWENNRVYFKIQNMEHGMFIKLEINPDDIGDRRAFGSNDSELARHAWVLEPVMIDGKVSLYIINRQFNQGLKLQMSTDSMGDRKLWGHNGPVYSDPGRFAWSIYRSFDD